MIAPVNATSTQSKYGRRQIIRDSGYTSIAAGTVCGITGMRQVKFPYKMKVHKYGAYLAAIAALLHWGAVKRWDKKLIDFIRK